MWEFWRRHKRKVYFTLGVFGSGYFLYKLYDAHRRRLSDLERELANERENDELIRAQLQEHFESIQRIADSTTLPHVMEYLSSQVADELDLTPIMEKLMKGKDQPNNITAAEKLDLWNQLKILSFTRMVLSIWAMTLISLYIRVQVNILGRHLYIDTAHGIGSSQVLDEADLIDRKDEQLFLSSADFLSNHGLHNLCCSIEAAASDVLQRKQLKDIFNISILHETTVQILDTFISRGGPSQWLGYLMPEDATEYRVTESSGRDTADLSSATKFKQLMFEARAVLTSGEFGNIVDRSLKTLVHTVMEDIKVQSGESNLMPGMPLAKLLPRIAQMGQLLFEEPSKSRYIHIIQNIPEVELFFTLLYSSTPTS